jgi:hypothetical protein
VLLSKMRAGVYEIAPTNKRADSESAASVVPSIACGSQDSQIKPHGSLLGREPSGMNTRSNFQKSGAIHRLLPTARIDAGDHVDDPWPARIRINVTKRKIDDKIAKEWIGLIRGQ